MSYKTLKHTWGGLTPYNLSGKKSSKEPYESRVTLSLPEWRQYIASGRNVLLAGAVIPGGTVQTAFGGSGAVYAGHVRQGY